MSLRNPLYPEKTGSSDGIAPRVAGLSFTEHLTVNPLKRSVTAITDDTQASPCFVPSIYGFSGELSESRHLLPNRLSFCLLQMLISSSLRRPPRAERVRLTRVILTRTRLCVHCSTQEIMTKYDFKNEIFLNVSCRSN